MIPQLGCAMTLPQVFYERAEELRSIAELVHDPRNRQILLKCAADYEQMAAQYKEASAQGGVFNFPARKAG